MNCLGNAFLPFVGRVAAVWLTAVVLAALQTQAHAGTRTYGDLTIDVDAPIQLMGQQGYQVYELTVSNRADRARTVRVSVPARSWSYGDSIESLSTTLRVEPGVTARTELLQPPVPMTGDGAAVWIDGVRQRDTVPLSIEEHLNEYGGEPILISRGVNGPVEDAFTDAMRRLAESSGSASYLPPGGVSYRYHTSDRLARMYVHGRPVAEWSQQWLSYTAARAVMVTVDELDAAPAAVQGALRSWVLAGGTLVVVGAEDLESTLGPAWRAGWSSLDEGEDEGDALRGVRLGLGRVQLATEAQLTGKTFPQWERWVRDVSQGPGVQPPQMESYDAERTLPLLSDERLPVRGLLVLMICFALLMGPVNIGLLTWLGRRMWLLWTVPVIALIFSATVLAYSLISEGIRPRARSVAVTLLDQPTRTAVTTEMTGYYAPLTPGGGLTFDRQTLIVPHTQADMYGYGSGRERSIDLTQGQHLTRGWVVARTPAHFSTRRVETRRERLEIRREGADLAVTNGLGQAIGHLLIADAQGLVYEARQVAAGAEVRVKPTGSEVGDDGHLPQRFDFGQPATISRLAGHPQDALSPGTYAAVLDGGSMIQPALAGLREHEQVGLVLGRWQEER